MGETRREFLKNSLLAAGGFIFGQTAKANISNTSKVQATTQAVPVAPEQKTEVKAQSEVQPPVPTIDLDLVGLTHETYEVRHAGEQALQTEPIKEQKEISLLFPNATPLEKSEAWEMIEKQISYYKNQAGYEKQLSDTLGFKNTIAVSAQNLGIGTDSILSELLLGMIFVESKGDPKAVFSNEEDSAKGLCQIKPSTALSITRELNMKVPPDLFKPQTNIILSLAHLKRLFSLFPDYSLSAWAYNLGETNMVEAIEEYLVMEKGANRAIIQSILNSPDVIGSAALVKEYNLNYIHLIGSKHVVDRLKSLDAFNYKTGIYVPQVAAATFLLNE